MSPPSGKSRRVLVLGATGTIGRATVQALVVRGHEVVAFIRPRAGAEPRMFAGATTRFGHVTDPASLARDGFCDEQFDVLMSCLASRTGMPKDAFAIDYRANIDALAAAKSAGVTQIVLLSAICVQRPLLAFQHAKLAFETALIDSGVTYSIVRPTAFFKSLSGQIERVRRGKPFLLFGDGELTACKPISDGDLATYLVECLHDADRHDQILPIGGPGEAITPRQQGEHLFALLGQKPKFRHVPVAMLDGIIRTLATLGHLVPALAQKAELARIGRFYATQSMLVFDAIAGRYDAHATPSTGTQTLFDFYAQVVRGDAKVERGDHTVF